MKEKVSLYAVATLKRIASLWIGYLVAIIPLYVFRANYHDTVTQGTIEAILMVAIVLLTAGVSLFLLYRRDDETAKLDKRGMIGITIIPTILHLLLCVLLCWSKYVYILLSGAYSLANILAPGAHDITEQAIWSVLVASLIVTPILAIGVWLGCLSARRQRKKEQVALRREDDRRSDL